MQGNLAFFGVIAALLAGYASLAERRRLRRHDPDQVGFMPWTTVAMLATVSAITLFSLSVLAGVQG